jgi:hypothetical protein
VDLGSWGNRSVDNFHNSVLNVESVEYVEFVIVESLWNGDCGLHLDSTLIKVIIIRSQKLCVDVDPWNTREKANYSTFSVSDPSYLRGSP